MKLSEESSVYTLVPNELSWCTVGIQVKSDAHLIFSNDRGLLSHIVSIRSNPQISFHVAFLGESPLYKDPSQFLIH